MQLSLDYTESSFYVVILTTLSNYYVTVNNGIVKIPKSEHIAGNVCIFLCEKAMADLAPDTVKVDLQTSYPRI